MASQPPVQLPLFYQNLIPLTSDLHASDGLVERQNVEFARATHAIPITVDEFVMAQRHYPIVFSDGAEGVPLALVGLKEGENLFMDANGNWVGDAYVPAYVRRYPFMLARLTPDAQVLSLVFDDKSGILSADSDNKMFDAEKQPTETTRNILAFCEQFEQAVARTKSFMEELTKLNLLMDGQAQIQNPGMEQPATFAGFKMIDEQKLQNLRGDQARKMVQNGMLGLVYAHLFSLSQMRVLYGMMVPEQKAA
ncbi:SapC family protein [Sandaracinobacteroides hominis]|uniref:SapC family protein n=1 Tax=Sandaracinobacteroides hominis TaxID=2780086 RepID=UPI0018F33AF5|nr:SapC family protein [Sandaracinobacteroides hominis]